MTRLLLLVIIVFTQSAMAYGQHDIQHNEQAPTNHLQYDSTPPVSKFYIGGGLGAVAAWTTFEGIGIQSTVFAGTKVSHIISTELALSYSNLAMKSSKGSENFYLANGKRFFAPVAGLTNYRYGDLESNVDLLKLEAIINFDITAICKTNSRWKAYASPAIGYAWSRANINTSNKHINEYDSFHLSMGAALSGVYTLNDMWKLGISSGVHYLTGNGIDGMPEMEYKYNIMWSTRINIIYKF